jgi:hypothetical protein
MEIRPDQFYQLNPENGEHVFSVNAKYDRVDHFPELGHWILKVYDDEDGLVGLHVDEATARAVIDYAELPVVERKFMYQSEYENYLKALESMMENWND